MELTPQSIVHKQTSFKTSSSDLISVRLMNDYEEWQKHNYNYKCATHSERDMSGYCKVCRQRICIKCSKDHGKHDTIPDPDLVINDKIYSIADAIEKFCGIKGQVEHVINLCDEQKEVIYKDQTKVVEDINQVFNQMHADLNLCQTELVQELQQVIDSCLDRLRVNCSQLIALKDDISDLAEITAKPDPIFDVHDLFDLEEHARQKLEKYTKSSSPLEGLRPNRLNIQVKWVDNGRFNSLIGRPLGKINCHLSPERLSLLQTVNLRFQSDKLTPRIVSMSFSNQRLFLCDASNGKVKVLKADYSHDKCFTGAGKHKITNPSTVVGLPRSTDLTSSSSTLLPSFDVQPGRRRSSALSSSSTISNVSTSATTEFSTVIVTDPTVQKVVLFNQFGQGIDMFETNGSGEAICVVPQLNDVECLTSTGNCLELLPIYDSCGFSATNNSFMICDTIDEEQQQHHVAYSEDCSHMNTPAAIVCSRMHDSVILECLQVNSVSTKLYKSRPDYCLNLTEDPSNVYPTRIVWNSVSQMFFVLESNKHQLLVVSGQDGQIFRIYGRYGSDNAELNYPTDVIVDKDGQILVADKNNNRIHLLDSVGNFQQFLRDGRTLDLLDIQHPTALSWDGDGNLIVCENQGKLKIYTY